jgi:DNA-binding transcriptional MocR family regulator
MARSWEAEFMELWRAGVETAAIAQALGIPRGTVASRAHALRRQGKIQARPKGGSYPRQQAQGRQAGTPAPPAPQVPPATPAAPAPPAPPAADRKEVQQWTMRLSKALIEHLKAVAYARRIPPSQLLEEWCWRQAHDDKGNDR